MAGEQSAPRVNGSMLPKYTGRTIATAAKYLGLEGGTSLRLETCDGQQLVGKLMQPLSEPLTPFIEIIGRVEYDCSLTVERIVCFGSDFDLNNYDEAVKLSQQFPAYFPQGKV